MNPDLAQFREKLVRLRNQADTALRLIDGNTIINDTALTFYDVNRTGFSIGDFTVLDRLPEKNHARHRPTCPT